MYVSIIVPAHNEGKNIEVLVREINNQLISESIEFEIILVNDNSTDDTGQIAENLAETFPNVRVIHRNPPSGFGRAIKDGFRAANGGLIIPVMGDLSDDPRDVVKLIRKAEEGYDVVYGSRFTKGGKAENYPFLKRFFNRSFNNFVRLLYGIKEKDVTNAFKAYRREVIEKIGIENIESNHFDITVELPMKAHILGFNSIEVPVSWQGRIRGVSKLKLAEMGPLYIKRLLRVFWLGIITGTRDILNVVPKTRFTTIMGSLLFGALLLLALFNVSGVDNIVNLLQQASLKWLMASSGIYFISFFFRTWRWSVLLRTIGHRVERGLVFRGMMFGWFLNALTPARLGDFGRTFALKACDDVPVSESLSTVVVERIMDLIMLFAFVAFIFGFMLENTMLHQISYAILILIVILILLMAIVCLSENFFERKIQKYIPRLSGILKGFVKGTKKLVYNPYALLLSIFLSFFVWIFEVFTVYFSAKSIGIYLPLSVSWISGVAAFVTQAVPTTPGGIGAYELSMAGVLSLFGIVLSQGTAIAIIDHAVRTFVVFFVGGISTIHLGFRSRYYFTNKNRIIAPKIPRPEGYKDDQKR